MPSVVHVLIASPEGVGVRWGAQVRGAGEGEERLLDGELAEGLVDELRPFDRVFVVADRGNRIRGLKRVGLAEVHHHAHRTRRVYRCLY